MESLVTNCPNSPKYTCSTSDNRTWIYHAEDQQLSTATTVIAQEEQLVAFRIADETYGVPIMMVHEIIRPSEITRIPRSLDFVRGVVNIRGKIVPVIDLRKRLGLSPAPDTTATRIIVVEMENGVIGMIVDSVSQVIHIDGKDIEPPSELIADMGSDLVRGVGKRDNGIVILLDIPKTLGMEARAA